MCLPNMCVDARSRRLFRAALGAAQLREVLLVWPDRHDFFVSGGVMLQPEIIHIGASNNIVTASVVTVLLALHALAASGLLLGLWPRSCAIISFDFTGSLRWISKSELAWRHESQRA